MADPLGATASILTLVDVCTKIVEYLHEVKDGPGERANLMREIYSTRGILQSLIKTVKRAEEDPEAWSETIRSLKQMGGPLDGLQEILFALHDELHRVASAKGLARVGKNLLWPFKKKSVEEKLKAIDRQQHLLLLALDNDQVALSRELRNDVQAVRSDVTLIRQEVEQRKDLEVLNWITTADYADQQNEFFHRRQPGTGRWLLESRKFQTWLETDQQMLFCPGIPGAGKTILASIVVNELRTRFANDAKVGIAYVYCNFRRKLEQRATDLLASLLRQLSQSRHSLPDSVKALYDIHNQGRTQPSTEELSQALRLVISLYARVFIVIDALDECQTDNGCRSRVLAEVFNLKSTNCLVTSRFISEITAKFDRSMWLEIRANKEDIAAYLEANMSHLTAFDDWSDELREDIKIKISETVDGMFLLARIYLQSLDDKTTPKAVKNALSQFRKEAPGPSKDGKREILNHAYKETMQRINEQKPGFRQLANKALAWITCSKRPLRASELQHALAVEVGDSNLDKNNLEKVERIVSVCAGLVTVQEGNDEIIEFVHYTTQEYFERTQEVWFPNAESEITTVCVTYLSFDVFGSGYCQPHAAFEARLRSNPLYDYTTRNWGCHAQKAFSLPHEVIEKFLRSQTRVEAASQVMMAREKRRLGSRIYSQMVPRKMSGLHLAAYLGVEKAVYALLEESIDPDTKNTDGRTPLSYAAEAGYEAVVKRLLTTGQVDPDSRDLENFTPLLYAAEGGYAAVVMQLLATGQVDSESRDKVFGQTALSWASMRGNEAVVRLLLTLGKVEPNSRNKIGLTPLLLAARQGHKATVRLLLATDRINPDARDKVCWRTPLSYAAEGGHAAIVQLLLATGLVDPDASDRDGRTPLWYAARKGQNTVVRLLLATGQVNLDISDKQPDAVIVRRW